MPKQEANFSLLLVYLKTIGYFVLYLGQNSSRKTQFAYKILYK